MHAYCPACCSHIALGDINVQADTAVCRRCGHATAYSAVIHAPTVGLYTSPPNGCHVEQNGERWLAIASTAGWQFFFFAPCALFWNAIVATFVVGALVHAPAGLVILPFLSLHIAAGIFVAWTAARYACGTIDVEIANQRIRVGSGIGPLRWWQVRELAYTREIHQKTRQGRGTRGPNW